MNRVELKLKAKEMLKEKFGSFWAGYLIVFGISFLCSLFVELLFKENTTIYSALTILASFFTMTLNVGFYSYMLKMVRGENYGREDIFKFVGNIFPIAAISLLVGILCFLWSILLIIPGIIAAISYTMVYMIYVEDTNLSPMDYLEKSKSMMNGYKADYFVFNLSFIGWILLSCITLGLGFIYTLPYISIAQTIYYDELKKIKEKEEQKN